MRDETPSSALAQAASYFLNHWTALTRFVEDGRLSLDNNLCERQIRDLALGRRNYLFAGSHDAARRSARLYSLMRTCVQHGVAPLPYLTDVIEARRGMARSPHGRAPARSLGQRSPQAYRSPPSKPYPTSTTDGPARRGSRGCGPFAPAPPGLHRTDTQRAPERRSAGGGQCYRCSRAPHRRPRRGAHRGGAAARPRTPEPAERDRQVEEAASDPLEQRECRAPARPERGHEHIRIHYDEQPRHFVMVSPAIPPRK
ncbi:MAG: transposase [Deltaproteobacteria bacterium]|nr:transposase [Deltaproteobacteria bacterium]